MNTTAGTTGPEPNNRPRSSFRDRMLILFTALLFTIAMAGWLWFLGWLSWSVVTWFINALD
jgi:hypothetical protein